MTTVLYVPDADCWLPEMTGPGKYLNCVERLLELILTVDTVGEETAIPPPNAAPGPLPTNVVELMLEISPPPIFRVLIQTGEVMVDTMANCGRVSVRTGFAELISPTSSIFVDR